MITPIEALRVLEDLREDLIYEAGVMPYSETEAVEFAIQLIRATIAKELSDQELSDQELSDQELSDQELACNDDPIPQPLASTNYDGGEKEAFILGLGTVRECRYCKCLVAGGPTSCVRCAKEFTQK